MRNVIAGGLTLTGALRRQAASQPAIGRTVARKADVCPATAPQSRAHPPHESAPTAPARFAQPGQSHNRSRARPAPVTRTLFSHGNAPFSPETVPGLGPEICAVLNTPLEECDPEIVRILLASLAQTIAQSAPSEEAGMTDAQALFSTLWGRLAGALDEAAPDTWPAAAPNTWPPATPNTRTTAAPVAPAEASPDMLSVSPAPPAQIPTPALPEPVPDMSFESLAPPPDAQAADLPDGAAIAATAAPETTPHTAALPAPVARGPCPVLHRGLSFQYSIKCAVQRPRWRFSRSPAFSRCGPPQQRLPLHWCYAARASPT